MNNFLLITIIHYICFMITNIYFMVSEEIRYTSNCVMVIALHSCGINSPLWCLLKIFFIWAFRDYNSIIKNIKITFGESHEILYSAHRHSSLQDKGTFILYQEISQLYNLNFQHFEERANIIRSSVWNISYRLFC